jgi:hypothetical protein
VQGEKGYSKKTGEPVSTPRMPLIGESFHAHQARIAPNMYPDAALLDDFGRPKQFIEFKFQCPAGVPNRNGGTPGEGNTPQTWTPGKKGKEGQLEKTIALGDKQDPKTDPPRLVTNEEC